MIELSRPSPKLPAHAMTTYGIRRPAHPRSAAVCEALGCLKWRHGWDSALDMADAAHARAAEAIRAGGTGLAYTELSGPHGTTLVIFRFAAHQACPDFHRKEPQFLRRNGDYRGNPRQELVRHASAGDWQEDFAEHQDHLADAIRRG